MRVRVQILVVLAAMALGVPNARADQTEDRIKAEAINIKNMSAKKREAWANKEVNACVSDRRIDTFAYKYSGEILTKAEITDRCKLEVLQKLIVYQKLAETPEERKEREEELEKKRSESALKCINENAARMSPDWAIRTGYLGCDCSRPIFDSEHLAACESAEKQLAEAKEKVKREADRVKKERDEDSARIQETQRQNAISMRREANQCDTWQWGCDERGERKPMPRAPSTPHNAPIIDEINRLFR